MKEAPKEKNTISHLKLGDFVRIKESIQPFNMNEMARVHDTLGEPPYVFLEKAAYDKQFGVEVYIRSRDQAGYPVRVLTGEAGSHDDAVNVYESGVIQIPLSFLEKVTPPRPEFMTGRVVRVNMDILAQRVMPFQLEGLRAKLADTDCKVLRIIEADDVKDPTITHYFALLKRADSEDDHSNISVPVEALETVH